MPDLWTRRRAHRSLENRADAVSHTAHRHHRHVKRKKKTEDTDRALEANTGYPIPQLSVASLRSRCSGPRDHDGVDGLITMGGMRMQGIQGINKTVGAVAEEVFLALLKQRLTRGKLQEAVVDGFERSSTGDAVKNVSLVEKASPFPPPLSQRLEGAAFSNRALTGAKGLRERVQRAAS